MKRASGRYKTNEVLHTGGGVQESCLPGGIVGAKILCRSNSHLGKFVVELRTDSWGDTASEFGTPGSRMSGGWKCVL